MPGPLSAAFRGHVLAQNIDGCCAALAAIRRYAQLFLQFPQTGYARLSGLADLFVSYCVANADVHTIQRLMSLRIFGLK